MNIKSRLYVDLPGYFPLSVFLPLEIRQKHHLSGMSRLSISSCPDAVAEKGVLEAIAEFPSIRKTS